MNDQNITTPSRSVGKSTLHVRHGDVIMRFGNSSSFLYTVKDPVGIHARPAGALVSLAKQYKSDIVFSAGEKSAHADSIIALMSLGATQGTQLKIEAHGEDAQEALAALRSFMSEHL